MFWQFLPLLAYINTNLNAPVIQYKLTYNVPKIFIELSRLVYLTVAQHFTMLQLKGRVIIMKAK